MDVSQDCDFKLLNLTVTDCNLPFAKISLVGSDKLNIIYHLRVVNLVMA